MSTIEKIESEYPKSWKYFFDYFNKNYKEIFPNIEFKDIPFEITFGIFISFFNSVSTDVDIYSNEIPALEDAVCNAFMQYEEYLFLDS